MKKCSYCWQAARGGSAEKWLDCPGLGKCREGDSGPSGVLPSTVHRTLSPSNRRIVLPLQGQAHPGVWGPVPSGSHRPWLHHPPSPQVPSSQGSHALSHPPAPTLPSNPKVISFLHFISTQLKTKCSSCLVLLGTHVCRVARG